MKLDIKVGDKIQWYNVHLNRKRQGIVHRIDEKGIVVLKDGIPFYQIYPPYDNKEITKFND